MAQEAVFEVLGTVLQPDQLQGIKRYASQELFRGGGLAAIIGALVLIYTGSRVFVELDDSINAIWSTPAIHVLHPVSPSSRCWPPCSRDCWRWR
jgi:membrane protein